MKMITSTAQVVHIFILLSIQSLLNPVSPTMMLGPPNPSDPVLDPNGVQLSIAQLSIQTTALTVPDLYRLAALRQHLGRQRMELCRPRNEG